MKRLLNSANEENTSKNSHAIAFTNSDKDQITLFYPASKGNVKISIFNSFGDVVSSNQTSSEFGLNSYNYNINNIPNGMYIVKIQNGLHSTIIPIAIKR